VPEGLIIGDSHVVAYAVRDKATMGSVVERLARSSGRPINVRQYGWPGANAPTFLGYAESLLRARNPVWVAVILNSYNIGVNALIAPNDWRMTVAPDYSFRLIDGRPPHRSRWPGSLRQLIMRSALGAALWRRLNLIEIRLDQARSSGSAILKQRESSLAEEAMRVPRATVLGLKQVFGARLLIVYAPELLGPGHFTIEPVEMELMRVCAVEGVACLSVREALDQDRNDHSRLSRGFHNTAPGVGHFNAIGHRIIGEEIWRYLCAHVDASTRHP
jgi:hypothetical protein